MEIRKELSNTVATADAKICSLEDKLMLYRQELKQSKAIVNDIALLKQELQGQEDHLHRAQKHLKISQERDRDMDEKWQRLKSKHEKAYMVRNLPYRERCAWQEEVKSDHARLHGQC